MATDLTSQKAARIAVSDTPQTLNVEAKAEYEISNVGANDAHVAVDGANPETDGGQDVGEVTVKAVAATYGYPPVRITGVESLIVACTTSATTTLNITRVDKHVF